MQTRWYACRHSSARGLAGPLGHSQETDFFEAARGLAAVGEPLCCSTAIAAAASELAAVLAPSSKWTLRLWDLGVPSGKARGACCRWLSPPGIPCASSLASPRLLLAAAAGSAAKATCFAFRGDVLPPAAEAIALAAPRRALGVRPALGLEVDSGNMLG